MRFPVLFLGTLAALSLPVIAAVALAAYSDKPAPPPATYYLEAIGTDGNAYVIDYDLSKADCITLLRSTYTYANGYVASCKLG